MGKIPYCAADREGTCVENDALRGCLCRRTERPPRSLRCENGGVFPR